MYSHTIVYFYIRTWENLVNVGSSRHKLPRHLQFCVGDTDQSGLNWSDMLCHRRHVATCRRHFQLSLFPVMSLILSFDRRLLLNSQRLIQLFLLSAPSIYIANVLLHFSKPSLIHTLIKRFGWLVIKRKSMELKVWTPTVQLLLENIALFAKKVHLKPSPLRAC